MFKNWWKRATDSKKSEEIAIKQQFNKERKKQHETWYECAYCTSVWLCEVVIWGCFRKSAAVFAIINILFWNFENF